MTRVAFLLCLVPTLSALAPARAAAQLDPDTTARAQRHFETGTQAFDTGDYELAVAEFQRAYELTEHPDLLFNIYSAAERAGRLEEAEQALSSYLEQAEVEPDRRPVLEQRLARLRSRIAAGETTVPDAPPVEDPAPVAEPPPEPEPADPAPVAPSPSGGGVHPAGIGVLIGAGALLASFAVFAALSEVEDGNLAATCGRDAGRTCSAADVSTLEAFNVVADVSWIGAAALGVVGVVLLVALPAEGGGDVAVAPWATPQAAGVTVGGRL